MRHNGESKLKLNKHKNSLLLDIIKIESKQIDSTDVSFFSSLNKASKFEKMNATNHTKYMSNKMSYISNKLSHL